MSITEEKIAIYQEQISTSLSHVKGRDIVIWGTRETGGAAKGIVESLGRTCLCFISSRPRTDMCYGLPIHKPDMLDREKHYVILSTSAIEVIVYLERKGFRWDSGAGTGEDWLLLGSEWHDDIELSGCPVGQGRYGYEAFDELIEIGSDVWIGTNAVILSGVRIGDGAVVGAGAIVTKDVEPYEIVGGVPARHICYRFSKEMIVSFLRIKWWNWSLSKIEENIGLFYQPELFCKTFDPNGKA